MYNNIFPYPGGGMNYMNQGFPQPMPQPQQQNALGPCQILTASGQASIDNLRMAPNSSVFIAHQTEPLLWKCVSDSLGNVTSTLFDVSLHEEKPPVDVGGLEKRVANIEQFILNLNQEEQKNESAVGRKQRAAGKQSGGEYQADQTKD